MKNLKINKDGYDFHLRVTGFNTDGLFNEVTEITALTILAVIPEGTGIDISDLLESTEADLGSYLMADILESLNEPKLELVE